MEVHNVLHGNLQRRQRMTESRPQIWYTLCLKNDTDVAHHNFKAHQPILVIFWQRCCWESMLLNSDLLSHLS